MTPSNIVSGFSASGAYPFNRDVFSDTDFMSSCVTDRPMNDEAVEDIESSPLLHFLKHHQESRMASERG